MPVVFGDVTVLYACIHGERERGTICDQCFWRLGCLCDNTLSEGDGILWPVYLEDWLVYMQEERDGQKLWQYI